MKIYVIDTFSFNGEEIVKERLKYLYDVVDEFVIIEAKQTHSGIEKEFLYRDKYHEWFIPYQKKIHWCIIDRFPEITQEWLTTYSIHDWMKNNHEHWYREAYQRDVAGQYITEKYELDEYVVQVSDADEIPNRTIFAPESLHQIYNHLENGEPLYEQMMFFYYNIHWMKKEQWYRACIVRKGMITANKTLTYWRVHNAPTYILSNGGWHCSYFMKPEELKRKLNSFAHRECDLPEYNEITYIQKCIETGRDIFGRTGEDLVNTPYEVLQQLPFYK